MKKLIVVDSLKDLSLKIEEAEVITAKEYLTNPSFTELKAARVFNLCKQYRYQSKGYYVSLLAEARGHKILPNISTIQDFKSQSVIRSLTDDLDELIQKSLKRIKSKEFILSIYFGQNLAKQYQKLCSELSSIFQAPLLRARFIFNKKWILQNITPIPLKEIPEEHKDYIELFAKSYFSRKRFSAIKPNKYSYDLAILWDPEEKSAPSDQEALERMAEVAGSMGFRVDLITKSDYSILSEYDALFIRETTAVNHHTYRFARKAESEGLIVIDDPASILRCTNKVFLAELLNKAKINTPETIIIHKDNIEEVTSKLGFPCVLKLPDSSFSQGVIKAKDAEEYRVEIGKMLHDSDLVIAQAYMPTDFDWRIGVLDKKPLYSCKYFMAKDHWQIYDWSNHSGDNYGTYETLPISKTPDFILQTAVKAASLIGDGLYGVDLKEIKGKAIVIEVNDNPSLDGDVEDQVLGNELYRALFSVFKQRLDRKRNI